MTVIQELNMEIEVLVRDSVACAELMLQTLDSENEKSVNTNFVRKQLFGDRAGDHALESVAPSR